MIIPAFRDNKLANTGTRQMANRFSGSLGAGQKESHRQGSYFFPFYTVAEGERCKLNHQQMAQN